MDDEGGMFSDRCRTRTITRRQCEWEHHDSPPSGAPNELRDAFEAGATPAQGPKTSLRVSKISRIALAQTHHRVRRQDARRFSGDTTEDTNPLIARGSEKAARDGSRAVYPEGSACSSTWNETPPRCNPSTSS